MARKTAAAPSTNATSATDATLTARLEALQYEAMRRAEELELHRVELEVQNRELSESREQLEASRARYAELYEQAPVAYLTLDLDGSIVQANLTAATLLGRPLALLAVTPFAAAARLQDGSALRAHLRECLASRRPETCEIDWTTPDGEQGALQLSTRVEVGSHDAPVGYRMTVVDTTALNRAKAEAVQLQSERRARAHADEANRLKDQFIAVVSHELRTPLNAIVGWTQIMQSRAVEDDRKVVGHGMDVVHRNAKTLARIVDDILDVSRIVAGKLYIELTETDLAEVVRQALELARPLASAKKIQLKDTLPNEAPVRGDAARLQQVVTNLLSNALKFTPPGGHLQVTLERVDATLRLKVSDDGCGIDAKNLPRVFESFRQADSSTRRSYGGLGLGLAIARHIVVEHGGQIEASSEGAGWGTTITVELPADVSPQPPPPRPSARSITGSRFAALSGAKVLFVDDDSAARELAELVLGAHGATVMSAGSVELALELATGFLPDVIVSDVAMPHRDGYDFIREVRNLRDPVGTVPALAVTAYARAEDARRALDAGFTMHLAKPSGPDELSAAVCELLERR